MKITVQSHRLTERLRPNHRTVKCFPSPYTLHHITKGYLQQFLLPSTSCLTTKKKITSRIKRQKTQFEDTEQASELDSDMAGMLELSGWELKTPMISMLGAQREKENDIAATWIYIKKGRALKKE